MLIDFNDLQAPSRIFIYPSSRAFAATELQEIERKIAAFLTDWNAHGEALRAGFEIRYNRFIIIATDASYQAPSGCSLDALAHLIQGLEQAYGLTLLDRMNVSFRQGAYIAYKELSDFKELAKNNSVSEDTIVFNNVVNTVEEYRQYWEVPLKESWYKRFLK